jgi:ribosomal protein S18 acetylase RimI-like enzyme|tara:strand:- start:246 stop:821 length:576 start_codon:yes stop_codon:yes gene_type:complete
MIKNRDDGYSIQFATWKDFPIIKRKISGLSQEYKAFYDPWMFRENPPIKIRLGQVLARLSLIRSIGKLFKVIFPYAFTIILKCTTEKNEIVGMMSMYQFKKLNLHEYSVIESKVIFEEFQKKGLGSFLTESYLELAKKEQVSLIFSGTRVDNYPNKKLYKKFGWELKKVEKNGILIHGKWYDMDHWQKKIN